MKKQNRGKIKDLAIEYAEKGWTRVGLWLPLQSEYMMESPDKDKIIRFSVCRYNQIVERIDIFFLL